MSEISIREELWSFINSEGLKSLAIDKSKSANVTPINIHERKTLKIIILFHGCF